MAIGVLGLSAQVRRLMPSQLLFIDEVLNWKDYDPNQQVPSLCELLQQEEDQRVEWEASVVIDSLELDEVTVTKEMRENIYTLVLANDPPKLDAYIGGVYRDLYQKTGRSRYGTDVYRERQEPKSFTELLDAYPSRGCEYSLHDLAAEDVSLDPRQSCLLDEYDERAGMFYLDPDRHEASHFDGDYCPSGYGAN